MSLAVAWAGVTEADALPVHSTVIAAGQVIVGGVVSTTMTSLVHEAALFETSFAVYSTTVSPSGYKPAAGPCTVTGEQTSDANAAPGETNAAWFRVHSTVTGGGQAMVGLMVSNTSICVLQLLALFDLSFAA